jgi:hypothetical protein
MDMSTAPTDGTRVLIQHQVYKWVPERHGSPFRVHKPDGTQWVECWFEDGKWRESETRTITPLAWADLPC